MEISLTELFLFVWASLATGLAARYAARFNSLTRLLHLISTNRALRKDFFEQHDRHFGELVK